MIPEIPQNTLLKTPKVLPKILQEMKLDHFIPKICPKE